jgi:hypothetical protein
MEYVFWPILIVIGLLARILLFIIGWKSLSIKTYRRLTKHKQSVVIFSHTSYADICILGLYMMCYPNRNHCVKTLVMPQLFSYLPFLKYFGAIPATKLEDSKCGAVQRICETLNKLPQFIFLISPKGSISRKPWRSGYYHITHQLQTNLIVAGLDYERKEVYISKTIKYQEYTQEQVETQLKSHLSEIVPLYPEREIMNIRTYDQQKLSIINSKHCLLCFSVIIITSLSMIV